MLQKTVLVGLLNFVFPGDLMQAACGLLITIIFMLTFVAKMPYSDERTNRLTIVTQSIMAFSFFCTIFLKVDLSEEYVTAGEIGMLMVWINVPMTLCVTKQRSYSTASPCCRSLICCDIHREAFVVQQLRRLCANLPTVACRNRYFMLDVLAEIHDIVSATLDEMEQLESITIKAANKTTAAAASMLRLHNSTREAAFSNPMHSDMIGED